MVSQKTKYCKNFERNSHWRKLSVIMVWERYCNASPKPEFFLFSWFIFSFISRLIWVRLGWNFHRWFSIQKQVNWCTIDPFSLKFCTSQHSYPVPLREDFFYGYEWKNRQHTLKFRITDGGISEVGPYLRINILIYLLAISLSISFGYESINYICLFIQPVYLFDDFFINLLTYFLISLYLWSY